MRFENFKLYRDLSSQVTSYPFVGDDDGGDDDDKDDNERAKIAQGVSLQRFNQNLKISRRTSYHGRQDGNQLNYLEKGRYEIIEKLLQGGFDWLYYF